jgi:hypothetical protein
VIGCLFSHLSFNESSTEIPGLGFEKSFGIDFRRDNFQSWERTVRSQVTLRKSVSGGAPGGDA